MPLISVHRGGKVISLNKSRCGKKWILDIEKNQIFTMYNVYFYFQYYTPHGQRFFLSVCNSDV